MATRSRRCLSSRRVQYGLAAVFAIQALMQAVGHAVGHGAVAGQDTFSGSLGLESRAFPKTALDPIQHSVSVGVVAEPELFWATDDGVHAFTLAAFARLDSGDSERTHFDVREANWLTYGARWELEIGFLQTFWGVTESQHLVDVINQTDLVESPDREDKLGEPAVHGTWLADWGTIDLYLMPFFRQRTLPGPDGRLRLPLVVDRDAAEIERTLSVGARWFHFLGPLDLGVSGFYGTSREPRFRTLGPPEAPTGLAPVYERIFQIGVDAQLTHESWLWKLEAITRRGQGDPFYAMTGGFEYTMSNIRNSGLDLGLLGEYSHDTREDTDPAAPLTALSIFDNDLFVGSRIALNDVQSTEVLGGALVDLQFGSVSWLIEASRRVGENFTMDFEVRAIVNTDPEDPLHFFRRDSFVQLLVEYHY